MGNCECRFKWNVKSSPIRKEDIRSFLSLSKEGRDSFNASTEFTNARFKLDYKSLCALATCSDDMKVIDDFANSMTNFYSQISEPMAKVFIRMNNLEPIAGFEYNPELISAVDEIYKNTHMRIHREKFDRAVFCNEWNAYDSSVFHNYYTCLMNAMNENPSYRGLSDYFYNNELRKKIFTPLSDYRNNITLYNV